MKSKWQPKPNSIGFIVLGGIAAFGAYCCMYAFRKAFTATTYPVEETWLGLDFKVGLVIAQVIGYALSKIIGIKLIAELKHKQRAALLLGLILFSELALVGFGWVRGSSWSWLFLFMNGLPLGLVWGIVFSYLEGRKTTEVLGAMLCVSFIVASGFVKSIGSLLINNYGVDVFWMPALTGALFLPFLCLFVYLLEQLPAPSLKDIAARTARQPIKAKIRRLLLFRLGPGLVTIICYYVLITALRDIRDNFALEIWSALGYGATPSIFTISEIPIAVLTLGVMVIGFFIQENRRALQYYHAIILVSTVLIILSTYLYQVEIIGGASWMIAVGTGLYLGYVPINAIYFDRLIGAFRFAATAGFLMYLADAAGYLGSVGVLLTKNFARLEISWLSFFIQLSYFVGVLGFVLVLASWRLIQQKLKTRA